MDFESKYSVDAIKNRMMVSSNIATTVFCTIQIEGTHNWPDCPFPEVGYLTYPHRHVFHIKAYERVTHSDRDVEFIMLKHKIQKYLQVRYYNADLQLCEFGSRSCEMIAFELMDHFNLVQVEVSEDNENGAVIVA